ncbi:MAG: hypothetical protein ACI8ZN_000878 [Bacteroidia bacterium]
MIQEKKRMKIVLIGMLVLTQFLWQDSVAQTDTVQLIYRDKKVDILSESDGSGQKRVRFNDGVKVVQVDINFEDLVLPQVTPPTETFLVRKHPHFTIKELQPIYFNLNFRFGLNAIKNFDLVSLPFLDPHDSSSFESRFESVGNEVMESRNTALHFGVEVPTKFNQWKILVGLGIDAQKIKMDGQRFKFFEGSKGTPNSGYRYLANSDYALNYSLLDAYDNYFYLTHLSVPIEVKYQKPNGSYVKGGLQWNYLFSARQNISSRVNYSMLGMVYYKSEFDEAMYDVRKNLSKSVINASLGFGKGIIGGYASVNLNRMFTEAFYFNELPNVRTEKRTTRLFTMGIQLNIL